MMKMFASHNEIQLRQKMMGSKECFLVGRFERRLEQLKNGIVDWTGQHHRVFDRRGI